MIFLDDLGRHCELAIAHQKKVYRQVVEAGLGTRAGIPSAGRRHPALRKNPLLAFAGDRLPRSDTNPDLAFVSNRRQIGGEHLHDGDISVGGLQTFDTHRRKGLNISGRTDVG